MKTIEVDFNSRDEHGGIAVVVDSVAVGDIVDLIDDEGNRCLARVRSVGSGQASLSPNWATFADADAPRLLSDDPRLHWYGPLTMRVVPLVRPISVNSASAGGVFTLSAAPG